MRSALAPAFTLTELLVVLAILGLVVSLVSLGAPSLFERGAREQARARLFSDLDRLSMLARREGVFGALEVTADGSGYQLTLGGAVIEHRRLDSRIRLRATPQHIAVDPAGRFASARLTLESKTHEENFVIDPITGRAARAGHGADRGARRRRRAERRVLLVSRRVARCAYRSCARAQSGFANRLGGEPARGNPSGLAGVRAFRRASGLFLGNGLPGNTGNSQRPACPDPLHGDRDAAAWAFGNFSQHGLGRTARRALNIDTAPAMTLLELLVALVVLSLFASLVFANTGPWLRENRRINREAVFWRAVPTAQLLAAELAASAINTQDSAYISATEARFTIYAPRFSDAPISAVLHIEEAADGGRLTLDIGADRAVIFDHAPPLRFVAQPTAASIILEAKATGGWAPLIVAPLRTDGPLECTFDMISRTCR